MNELINALLIIALLLIFTYPIYRWIKISMLFKADPCNPYRRYCKKCGQQQDMYSTNYADCTNHSWWQDMYSIKDENCKCHKYSANY